MMRTLRECIGAMIMVGVRGANMNDPAMQEDLARCEEAHVGGVILFDVDLPTMAALQADGVPADAARVRAVRNIVSSDQLLKLTNDLRNRLGSELIIAVDHEGGATTRLSQSRGFPPTRSAAEWSALTDIERAHEAALIAEIAAGAGITLNFAPCVDLSINPANPIISGRGRSYGADAAIVSDCAATFIDAHRARRVMTCLKHFPGHGSTRLDSHHDLPHISESDMERELMMYERLLPRLDPSTWVMTGHLMNSATDADSPASLSRAHTTGLLRERCGFDSVIVTDSLDMGAVTQRFTPAEAVVAAVNAGADVILDGANAPGAPRANPATQMMAAIESALREGRIFGGADRIEASANRIETARRAVSA